MFLTTEVILPFYKGRMEKKLGEGGINQYSQDRQRVPRANYDDIKAKQILYKDDEFVQLCN